MFTISCYDFHPLVKRFVTLWRYVRVVSDCLTFVCSILCCQCWQMLPMSNESNPSEEAFQFLHQAMIDPGRASGEPLQAQHLIIDFTPKPEDTEEVQKKCEAFWQFVNNNPKLEGMKVLPEKLSHEVLPSSSVQSASVVAGGDVEFPAVHTLRTLENKGAVKTAFVAKDFNKCIP